MTRSTFAKAQALLARNREWLRLRDDAGRIVAYGVPSSQPGKFYRTNGRRCECEGFTRRGECSHMSAATLYINARRAGQPAPAPQPVTATGRTQQQQGAAA